MSDNKMQIKITDAGIMELDVVEFLEHLEPEQVEELIKRYAWSSPIWDELKRGMLHDYAGQSWNSSIWNLRMLWLRGPDADKRILAVLSSLLEQIQRAERMQWQAETGLRRVWSWLYKTFERDLNGFKELIKDAELKYLSSETLTLEMIDAKLKSISGFTVAELQAMNLETATALYPQWAALTTLRQGQLTEPFAIWPRGEYAYEIQRWFKDWLPDYDAVFGTFGMPDDHD